MNQAETYRCNATERLTTEVRRLQAEGLELEAAIERVAESSIAGPSVWVEVRERLSPWVLRRDGDIVGRFLTEGAAWHYLHATHCYSVSHALQHEGWSLTLEG